jgi:hypothetical protein
MGGSKMIRPTPETDAAWKEGNAIREWTCRKLERGRDEARKEIENIKLQLGLWEDGNLICEDTRGEIRLFEEQIKQALLERNKAYKIAKRAIDDLAWFNETNARTLQNELKQLKEEAK